MDDDERRALIARLMYDAEHGRRMGPPLPPVELTVQYILTADEDGEPVLSRPSIRTDAAGRRYELREHAEPCDAETEARNVYPPFTGGNGTRVEPRDDAGPCDQGHDSHAVTADGRRYGIRKEMVPLDPARHGGPNMLDT